MGIGKDWFNNSTAVSLPGRCFLTAWFFFAIAAALGALLRMQLVFPVTWVHYGNLLHAHSHVAFLGWVFNTFFALALRFFVPPERRGSYARLFLLTQVTVVGMLATFPFQGYARESIVFSTGHMVFAVIFVVRVLRENHAGPAARPYLWAAAVFMIGSAAGPLSLGPLMLAEMRNSPWYDLAVGYYLHFQYNGWFVFFLLAVALQSLHEGGKTRFCGPARKALPWLVAGCVASVVLAALPMRPPGWVFGVAALGAVFQITGCGYGVRALTSGERIFRSGAPRVVLWLAGLAGGAFLLRTALQALASWPGLLNLATNHFTIIAFMHLIFLGIVAPMTIAWAIHIGWLRWNTPARIGIGLFLGAALVSQSALAYLPLAGRFGWPGWPAFNETQFISALAMFAGIVVAAIGSVKAVEATLGARAGGNP